MHSTVHPASKLRTWRRDQLILLALVAILPAVALRSGWAPHYGSASSLNLLLVTLDTTRADALGAYGGRAVTPSFDYLAAEGVLFEQASTVAPLTLPAHSSLFTGLFPPGHGIHGNGQGPLDSGFTTLAECLKARGFRTGAFVSSFVLDQRWGLDQGFDVYHDTENQSEDPLDGEPVRRPADQVVDDALEWLSGAPGDRFFAWLHFYDAHAPARPPTAFAAADGGDAYYGALSFVDFQFSRVLTFLSERQILDRTIVVVIGDHGESLGEHGEATHGLFIYEGVLRVPFVIRTPFAIMRGRRVADPVRIVDAMPTVLDLLQQPRASGPGQTLVPLMTGIAKDLGLEAYSESTYGFDRFGWSPLRALRKDRFKLILAPRPELYDLVTDPSETINLYHQRPKMAASLTVRLRGLEERAWSRYAGSSPVAPDTGTLARLATLGYLASTSRPVIDPQIPLADPKDRIDLYNRLTSRNHGALP